jgi:hypothetical protein
LADGLEVTFVQKSNGAALLRHHGRHALLNRNLKA